MEIRRNDNPQADRFWGGFAAGALIGTAASVAAVIISHSFRSSRDRRIVRLEDSVQIGRPVAEVFPDGFRAPVLFFLRNEVASLDQQDASTGRRQRMGHRAAASAAADDDYVELALVAGHDICPAVA